MFRRPACIHHATSEPYRFFGRETEIALLDAAAAGSATSLVAFVGPGGQGKTAIVQHWLERLQQEAPALDGLFFWSFYRGKDTELFLRELYAYAEDLSNIGEVSATWCVDHLLPRLRRERWVILLDGTEVVQYDAGPWFGRFIHPELSRLLEELASAAVPGVTVLTTRFSLPELERRPHARLVHLAALDDASARGLLQSLGVKGTETELETAAALCGHHAKAVELLGTFLVQYHDGCAAASQSLPSYQAAPDASEEEQRVARILAAYQAALPEETQDILALATAFRDPATEARLLDYLAGTTVRTLLHDTWKRNYVPFANRPGDWLQQQLNWLIRLRLLERVHGTRVAETDASSTLVIDAHPLVRRAFEHVLGPSGRRQAAQARAGFLRGRPDRRRPATLQEAAEEIELFHAFCDAGLWNEADGVYVALENPKHRFLAPALERDLLLRFFPSGDWRQPPLWSGFGRRRSLAISFELLGCFADAVAAYPATDLPLRGDALLALGDLQPLLTTPLIPQPWSQLWQAYRAHALCLAGQLPEALALARSLIPVDVYEWIHVFECLLRAGGLAHLDPHSLSYSSESGTGQRWSQLARQRMAADLRRIMGTTNTGQEDPFADILVEYDRAGLPWERALTRLSHGRWHLQNDLAEGARTDARTCRELAERHGMRIMLVDALELEADVLMRRSLDQTSALQIRQRAAALRREIGYHGPTRP